jgi:hypothetical protein
MGHPHKIHNQYNHNSKSGVIEISCKNSTFSTIVVFDDYLVNKNISLEMNVSPAKIQLFSSSLLKKRQKLSSQM